MQRCRSDVVIVGAGIVGCALAYELAHYNLTVTVLEKEADVGWGASKANSGIIHSSVHNQPGTLKARLCREGNELYRELAPQLGVKLRHTGMLIVAQTEDQIRDLEELRERGMVNGETDLKFLSRAELLEKEPELSPSIIGGLLAPSAATVAPYQMTIALYEAARTNGVKFYFQEPLQEIEVKDGNIFSLRTANYSISTRWVIDAAGLEAGEVAELAGCGFSITPRAGEEYILDKKWGTLVSHLIFPLPTPNSKGILAIPTSDGNLMVGPTAVDGSSQRQTTFQGRDEVFSSIQELLPRITQRDVIASFAGVRPISPTGDFLIGPTDVGGFYLAAGMESPGLTAAPAVAKYLIKMLSEDGLPLVPKETWTLRKVPICLHALTPTQLEGLISKDPAWGRIICRCEEVTEAEVIEAIRRGAQTLDGIKFRTRLGMGRCQGGFCGPRVLGILARELNLPLTEITKKGKGSEIAPVASNELHLERVESK